MYIQVLTNQYTNTTAISYLTNVFENTAYSTSPNKYLWTEDIRKASAITVITMTNWSPLI